jgi:hypothetical protein
MLIERATQQKMNTHRIVNAFSNIFSSIFIKDFIFIHISAFFEIVLGKIQINIIDVLNDNTRAAFTFKRSGNLAKLVCPAEMLFSLKTVTKGFIAIPRIYRPPEGPEPEYHGLWSNIGRRAGKSWVASIIANRTPRLTL